MIYKSFLVFSLFLVFSFVSGCEQNQNVLLKTGDYAPVFSLKGLEGDILTLGDYKGRMILLVFWSTGCRGCAEAVPFLKTIQYKFQKDGVAVIALNVDSTIDKDRVRQYVRKNKITYPVAFSNKSLNKKYGVRFLPAIYLLDKDHRLRDIYHGFYRKLYELVPQKIKELQ